jgi:hypothetical protein
MKGTERKRKVRLNKVKLTGEWEGETEGEMTEDLLPSK